MTPERPVSVHIPTSPRMSILVKSHLRFPRSPENITINIFRGLLHNVNITIDHTDSVSMSSTGLLVMCKQAQLDTELLANTHSNSLDEGQTERNSTKTRSKRLTTKLPIPRRCIGAVVNVVCEDYSRCRLDPGTGCAEFLTRWKSKDLLDYLCTNSEILRRRETTCPMTKRI